MSPEARVKTETILKIAGSLLGWLIMGVWFSAKIMTGFDSFKIDMQRMEFSINHLSDRLDRHIEKESK